MDTTSIPPDIAIIVQEKLWNIKNPTELSRLLKKKGLLRELRRQSEWTLENFKDPEPPKSGFIVCPSGSLNPLSENSKCSDFNCRIKYADEFVKSVALYSDAIIVVDPFITDFLFEQVNPEILYRNLAVLKHIMPLISAGVLFFNSPFRLYCKTCSSNVQARVNLAVDHILVETLDNIKISPSSEPFVFDIESPLFSPEADHPLIRKFRFSARQADLVQRARNPRDRALKLIYSQLARVLKSEVHSLMYDLITAQQANGILLAKSRLELLSLADLSDVRPNLSNIEHWEALRSLEIPWINALTPSECMILRSEAPVALAKLRALLAENISQSKRATSIPKIVADLRAQVANLEAELNKLGRFRGRIHRATLQGLSIAFVVYGLSTSNPAVSATSIAALLASMVHTHKDALAERKADIKVTASPAYALLKARRILNRRSKHQTHE
ncbi:MAG: hypothetical protein ABR936_15235 [Bacteroidota bacterium]|jgi:hypothetical protein